MRASVAERAPGLVSLWRLVARRLLLPVPERLRDRRFWIIQGLVAAVTAFHIAGEITEFSESYGALRHFPVALYVIPVAYAALCFGIEGGLLTGLWSLLLAAPNVTIWHQGELEGDIGVLLLVLAIGLVLAWRAEREATLRHQAEAAREELVRSQQRLQFYLRKITDAQEAERQRVARELHDDTLQTLVLVGRTLDALTNRLRPEDEAMRAQLEAARTQVDAAIDGVRRLARDLRPPMLDRLGLVPSIEWVLGDVERRGAARTRLYLDGEIPRLSPEVELLVFRIVQEAVRNAEVHGRPTTIEVMLGVTDQELHATVRDDGQGFDVRAALANPERGGLGLQGMRERAQLAGGTVEITSQPGRGTVVDVRVPLHGRP